MITDKNNCRQVTLGNGTIFLETDTTGKILIIGEKPKTPVGEPYSEGDGDDCTKVDYKTVCLYFDGTNAAESMTMLFEYLNKIKVNLKAEKTPTLPYTFKAGEKAKADEVNANFEFLHKRILKLENFRPEYSNAQNPSMLDYFIYFLNTLSDRDIAILLERCIVVLNYRKDLKRNRKEEK